MGTNKSLDVDGAARRLVDATVSTARARFQPANQVPVTGEDGGAPYIISFELDGAEEDQAAQSKAQQIAQTFGLNAGVSLNSRVMVSGTLNSMALVQQLARVHFGDNPQGTVRFSKHADGGTDVFFEEA